MQLSKKGAEFIERHEGFVSRAYRDAVGVWTIGTGFTNMSKTAVRMLGKIAPGKTITREQSRRVLIEAVSEEYGPPVERGLPNCNQHEYDAGCSVTFNCGPGAMTWAWARLWRGGQKRAGWVRLRTTAVTGRGPRGRRKLAGLVRRRREESDLGLFGNYGFGIGPGDRREEGSGKEEPDKQVLKAQANLVRLGADIAVDGYLGPKTKAALLAFQKAHPNLKNDGILGPATQAQLERAVSAKGEAKTGGGVAGTGAAGAVVAAYQWPNLWPWIVGGVALVLVAGGLWLAIRRREELTSWINRKLGREVE